MACDCRNEAASASLTELVDNSPFARSAIDVDGGVLFYLQFIDADGDGDKVKRGHSI
jgi:hypothetical protein